MCTSLTLKTNSNGNLMARTMDFAYYFGAVPIFIPRNFEWRSVTGKKFKGIFSFLGMGVKNDNYTFCDGVNEKGLICATLYFPKMASYKKENRRKTYNLAPHEVVQWALSNFTTITEVKEACNQLNIVKEKFDLLGIILPLHWIFTDLSGKSIVVEPTNQGLIVYDNPIGVMTNSPEFCWHITNLNNFSGIRSKQSTGITTGGIQLESLSQGNGAWGLPGDFTSTSRFVKTVFLKESIEIEDYENAGIEAAFHILEGVSIPKGCVVTSADSVNYTQFISVFSSEERALYFSLYNNRQINKVALLENDLNSAEPKIYDVQAKQAIETIYN